MALCAAGPSSFRWAGSLWKVKAMSPFYSLVQCLTTAGASQLSSPENLTLASPGALSRLLALCGSTHDLSSPTTYIWTLI